MCQLLAGAWSLWRYQVHATSSWCASSWPLGHPLSAPTEPYLGLQVEVWDTTYYTQTSGQLKGWWTVVGLCTGALNGLCEIPRSYYACPPAPPPRPPPVVIPTGTCEWQLAATPRGGQEGL